ncbi:MAG TPA: DoxX family protein [Edaphobacter sp.]|jgi:putative oxidoreductase|nr:DoxX family protein [Edaphobacter sp.]
MKSLNRLASAHGTFCTIFDTLRSPFLLAVRLYWGWQFVQTGLGKLRHLPRVVDFFASLNIPLPWLNAHFVAGLEFFGGMLLIIGLFSRPISLMFTGSMLVAYWTAEHEALASIFSDPGKFYTADSYTFLFAALLILIFGPGLFSLDALLAKRFPSYMQTPHRGMDAVVN